MSLDDLLGAATGGARPQQSGGDLLSGLLGSLMGGASEGGPDLTDLLGGILGGMQGDSAGAGGLGDILGSILGGAEGISGASSPQVEGLAKQFGIPPEMIVAVVSMMISRFARAGRGSGGATPRTDPAASPAGRAQELDLSGLLRSMGGEEDSVREISEKTGLDQEKAAEVLQGVMGILGIGKVASSGGKAPAREPSRAADRSSPKPKASSSRTKGSSKSKAPGGAKRSGTSAAAGSAQSSGKNNSTGTPTKKRTKSSTTSGTGPAKSSSTARRSGTSKTTRKPEGPEE